MTKHFTASGLVFHEGKVLLLKHKKLGSWIYPGGHIEENESPDEGVVREIYEETGYRVEVLDFGRLKYCDAKAKILPQPFCVLEENIDDGGLHTHIDFVYICKLADENAEKSKENTETAWFTREMTAEMDMLDNFRYILNDAFERLSF